MRKIGEGAWDIVVLQEQSQTPAVFPDRFHRAAREIDRLIDEAGARTVFYATLFGADPAAVGFDSGLPVGQVEVRRICREGRG
jgi:hypothetical protein